MQCALPPSILKVLTRSLVDSQARVQSTSVGTSALAALAFGFVFAIKNADSAKITKVRVHYFCPLELDPGVPFCIEARLRLRHGGAPGDCYFDLNYFAKLTAAAARFIGEGLCALRENGCGPGCFALPCSRLRWRPREAQTPSLLNVRLINSLRSSCPTICAACNYSESSDPQGPSQAIPYDRLFADAFGLPNEGVIQEGLSSPGFSLDFPPVFSKQWPAIQEKRKLAEAKNTEFYAYIDRNREAHDVYVGSALAQSLKEAREAIRAVFKVHGFAPQHIDDLLSTVKTIDDLQALVIGMQRAGVVRADDNLLNMSLKLAVEKFRQAKGDMTFYPDRLVTGYIGIPVYTGTAFPWHQFTQPVGAHCARRRHRPETRCRRK